MRYSVSWWKLLKLGQYLDCPTLSAVRSLIGFQQQSPSWPPEGVLLPLDKSQVLRTICVSDWAVPEDPEKGIVYFLFLPNCTFKLFINVCPFLLPIFFIGKIQFLFCLLFCSLALSVEFGKLIRPWPSFYFVLSSETHIIWLKAEGTLQLWESLKK